MTQQDDRGGTPFESITPEAQLAIRGFLEQLGMLNIVVANGGPLMLLQVSLLAFKSALNDVMNCEAPHNTIIPKELRLSDAAAETIASVVEIPDHLPEFWPEGEI